MPPNVGKTALIYFIVTIYLGLRPRINQRNNNELIHWFSVAQIKSFQFSERNGTVHIRRIGQKGSIEVDISQVTPSLIQDTFELKYPPTYLKVEPGIRVVQISSSTVRPNEHYIIEGPLGSGPKAMSRNRKKKSQGDHTGISLLRSKVMDPK